MKTRSISPCFATAFLVTTLWTCPSARGSSSLGYAINGNCTVGSCPAQPLGYNTTATLPFSTNITLSNGDNYTIAGSFSTANNGNGGTLTYNYGFIVTYSGNGSGGGSGDDTLRVDSYSAFTSVFSTGTFNHPLSGIYSAGISNSSTVQMCGGSVCVGPISPPGPFFSQGGNYSLNPTGGAFLFDNTFTIHFGAGSRPGSYIVLSIPQLTAPSVLGNGIVPVFSASPIVQPGSWISIYGSSLSVSTTSWKGDFPTSLGGVTVMIDGKPTYLWYVSPTQINLQVPDDAYSGPVNVVISTPAGSASSTVTLSPYAPSFSMLSSKYVAATVSTPNSSGNSGAGYDVIGPAGAFSYPSRPARPGETVALYGVGFGPTNPSVPAGKAFTGAAPSVTVPQITIGGMNAIVTFAGIVQAGLFQFNVVIPDLSSGDQPLQATINSQTTQNGVFLTIQ